MTEVAEVRERLRSSFGGTMIEGALLAGFTTFHIGGPAALLAVPEGIDDLSALLEAVAVSGAKLLVLGRGSNVLVSDRGFDGVVAVLSGGLRRITKKGKHEVYVESGCDLNVLVKWTIELGLGGLEELSGIPGSVGGAIRMNAGAMGSSMGDRVMRVKVLSLAGKEVKARQIGRGGMGFAYRHSGLGENDIVVGARLKLGAADRRTLESRRGEVLAWRRRSQPLNQPSAGSVFRNPPGMYAGELIERCGLKGVRIGEAMVSEKHANFIVNLGGASADDVRELIRRVKNEVKSKKGVELEEEIKLVGEMGEGMR
jgi:UDP-N-acetylmuramate dehydrogenase